MKDKGNKMVQWIDCLWNNRSLVTRNNLFVVRKATAVDTMQQNSLQADEIQVDSKSHYRLK